MILHIVNKSPFNSDALASCLRIINTGDALLLIEEGVYAAAESANPLTPTDDGIPIYALTADLSARGLNGKLAEGVQPVNDGEFVDLIVRYASSQSWY